MEPIMTVQTRKTALELVGVKRKSLEEYRNIVGDGPVEEARTLARERGGLRLLHLSSTATGGGVAELLNSLVPLEADCGLDVQWRLLCPSDELFKVTKGFHNGLQGEEWPLDAQGKEIYLSHNRSCAEMLDPDDYDVVIVHDPQPAAFPYFVAANHARWVWRCHIDSSQPNDAVWQFLHPYVSQYDAAVFTMKEFVPPGLSGPRLHFIPPAIDPLSPKNRALPKYLCREEVAEFGVDLARPLTIQVSRFDPWKDPWGVIKAYRLVKEELPSVQLALIGFMADDDPQGWEIYNSVRAEAEGDSDIHILTNLNGVGAHEVNAFQRAADVVIQKSVREGFGLVVSEAVWKGTPVVAGNTGGIPLQIQNGTGGFLVDTVEECADRVAYLLEDSDAAEHVARRGWEWIRDRFLMPRLLRDELQLLGSLTKGDSGNGGPPA
jgi:trehalose synthase